MVASRYDFLCREQLPLCQMKVELHGASDRVAEKAENTPRTMHQLTQRMLGKRVVRVVRLFLYQNHSGSINDKKICICLPVALAPQ